MANNRHRYDFIVPVQLDATHPDRGAAVEHAHIGGGKADGAARVGHQHDVIVIRGDACVDQGRLGVIVLELHGNLAITHNVCEIRKLVPTNSTGRRRKDHLQIVPIFFVAVHGHNRRNGHAGRDRQDVNDRLTFRRAPALGQAPGFELVDHAVCRKEQ